ncbi:MAG: MBL fold metallo-hydrolase [Chloroflexota bacterium]|nr:MBL fold metallo-hydrolase [Chloroflexota bacterium]
MTEITCVVDNTAKKNSSLRSEHGLAFWIETGQGSVLFDTGQTEAVLSYNLAFLGLRPQDVDALAFSHAHYDHTGGAEVVLSQHTGLPTYAHSDIFRPRYSLHKGEYRFIGLGLTQETLADRVQLHLSDVPVEILSGLWTTGEIVSRPEPEGRSDHHFIRSEAGWQLDPYRDDLSLVLKTQAGLVLICGCCHAGLLNTLFHVERSFDGEIIAVLGGTHLMSANEAYLAHVIDVLDDRYKHIRFYLNHCTGERAYRTLANVFGKRVKACPAGTVVRFDS